MGLSGNHEVKKRTPRLSLTKKQLASSAGTELLVLCQNITADGSLNEEEVNELRLWLDENRAAALPSIEFLTATVERIITDGIVTREERTELYKALESVLPTEVRQAARARRAAVESEESAKVVADKAAAKEKEREEKRRLRPIESFDFMVAGVHYNGRSKVIRDYAGEGDRVSLVREPSNKYSKHATRIMLKDRFEIGFVPEEDAQVMSQLLDAEHSYTAIVKKILTGGRAPIPVIVAKFYRKGVNIAEVVPPDSSGYGCLLLLLLLLLFGLGSVLFLLAVFVR